MWPFKKKKVVNKQSSVKEYQNGLLMAFDYHKFFTPELIEWFANENDPVKLSSAYCLINCWSWPDFMPLANGYNYKTGGYGIGGSKNDYNMIKFGQTIMNDLKAKAEKISPGTCQQVWMSRIYQKYKIQNVEQNPEECDTTKAR